MTTYCHRCTFTCRSTSALHVDPQDAYGLVNYADRFDRQDQVLPLRHIEKDNHFHGPFHVPSSALFEVGAYLNPTGCNACRHAPIIMINAPHSHM